MSEEPAAAPAPEARPSVRVDRRKLPRHGFWKGAAAGLLVTIPAVALTVWASAGVGLLDHDAGVIACLRLTVVFAGLAAVLTAGGVGRLAAQASIERPGTGIGTGRVRAMLVAARTMAPAGSALTLIAAMPHGGLPMTGPGWVILALVGVVPGALSGAAIGAVSSGEMPTLQELGVWPPTEWPLPWRDDDDDEPKPKTPNV